MDKTTHISFSGYSMVPNASTLLVSFLAGALIIHAYNRRYQASISASPSPENIEWAQWALCSRRLFRAALWAAGAMIVPMMWQLLMVLNMQSTSVEINSTIFGSVTLMVVAFASSISLIVSIATALYAVSSLLPQFSLGDPICVDERCDADPDAKN